MAVALAERIARTRRVGAAVRRGGQATPEAYCATITEDDQEHDEAAGTRPQAMAVVGSLLAGVTLAAGERDRLASAVKAGMKLAAFRDVLGSRGAAAPIDPTRGGKTFSLRGQQPGGKWRMTSDARAR